MIQLVKITSVQYLDEYRLRVQFSDGSGGVRDYADMIAEGGPMVVPLHDPTYFARVFLEHGVLTWPNGFDVDAIGLHDEMALAGAMQPATANAAE